MSLVYTFNNALCMRYVIEVKIQFHLLFEEIITAKHCAMGRSLSTTLLVEFYLTSLTPTHVQIITPS